MNQNFPRERRTKTKLNRGLSAYQHSHQIRGLSAYQHSHQIRGLSAYQHSHKIRSKTGLSLSKYCQKNQMKVVAEPVVHWQRVQANWRHPFPSPLCDKHLVKSQVHLWPAKGDKHLVKSQVHLWPAKGDKHLVKSQVHLWPAKGDKHLVKSQLHLWPAKGYKHPVKSQLHLWPAKGDKHPVKSQLHLWPASLLAAHLGLHWGLKEMKMNEPRRRAFKSRKS